MPTADRPEEAQPPCGPAEAVVEALCASALRLLGAAGPAPARLRLAAGDASVELEWTPRPAAGSVGAELANLPLAAGDRPAAPANGHLERPGQHPDLSICAPMVGTFYHAPEPGSAPFVRPGDVIDAGQQVGILEVMKLMVPVESGQRARVVEFLVADATPVEHGQPLISCADA